MENGEVLSEREKKIVCLMADDLRSKEIAHQLQISESTVQYHRDSIKRRLGVQGTAGMVRYAIREGWINP